MIEVRNPVAVVIDVPVRLFIILALCCFARPAMAQVDGGAPASPLVEDQVMAWVGKEPIFASEIMARVDPVMEENRAQIPASNWDEQRMMLAQGALKATVDAKIVLVDALRKIPAAGQTELQKRVDEQFEAKQIPLLMKSLKVESRSALEQKLLAAGSSVEQQRRSYYERSLAYQWQQAAAKVEKEISYNEMVDYYQAHLKDYARPARARWEQLSVHFEQFPSKQAAFERLSQMGNDVLRGVAWAEVARAASHGSTAQQGGVRDWTTQGSLASKVLDQALFSLPLNSPSQILEDERGFHIVRVVEREEAGRVSFRDAQVKIKEEIDKQRQQKAVQEYQARLRKETHVWTVFDDPVSARRFAESQRTRKQ